MDPTRSRRPQWTLGSMIAGVVVLAVLVAVAMPTIQRSRMAHREREAGAAMKTLCTAESDFRSHDRENDRVANFWVRDVSALYTLCPSLDGLRLGPAEEANMLRMITPSLAAACVSGFGDATAGVVRHEQAFGPWAPRSGYVFRTFTRYQTTGGSAIYGEDGPIVAWKGCHSMTNYAFMALPVDRNSGENVFCVDAAITIWRVKVSATFWGSFTDQGTRAVFRWGGVDFNGSLFGGD